MDDPGVYAWLPGGEVRRISPPVGFYAQPWVHPDGMRAVFWGGAIGTPGVWQTDLERDKSFRLTSMASGSWQPAYAPDGEHIVFVSDRYGHARSEDMDEVSLAPGRLGPAGIVQAHIFIMRLDGRGVRQLTAGEHYDQRPAVSPDGSTVAFVSNRGGRPGLWLLSLDVGGEPQPIETPGAMPECARWSHDGRRIYFTYRRQDASCVGCVETEGGKWDAVERRGEDHADCCDPFADASGESLLLSSSDGEGAWRLHELSLQDGRQHVLQPPGFRSVTHATRARSGVVVFESRDFPL